MPLYSFAFLAERGGALILPWPTLLAGRGNKERAPTRMVSFGRETFILIDIQVSSRLSKYNLSVS